MAEVFQPLLSETFLKIFTWVFGILSLGLLIWFVLYTKNSKNQKMTVTVAVIMWTSLCIAITIQLLMVMNNVQL